MKMTHYLGAIYNMRLLVFSFCLLYAGEIPHADADGEIGELFEGHKWTRTGRVLHCRAAKISKAYFPEEDHIWISLYRLSQYRLYSHTLR